MRINDFLSFLPLQPLRDLLISVPGWDEGFRWRRKCPLAGVQQGGGSLLEFKPFPPISNFFLPSFCSVLFLFLFSGFRHYVSFNSLSWKRREEKRREENLRYPYLTTLRFSSLMFSQVWWPIFSKMVLFIIIKVLNYTYWCAVVRYISGTEVYISPNVERDIWNYLSWLN